MSDTDANSGNSGDASFDKEAEREKLREKFARDEEKRESTRRMSELLLQGATMTNRHCDVCGDPLFRQNGQEFCATCRAEGREAQARPEEADASSTDRRDRPADSPSAEGSSAEVSSAEAPSDEPTPDERAATDRTTEADALAQRPSDDPAGRSAGDAPAAHRHVDGRRRTPPSQAESTDDGSHASPPSVTTPSAGQSGDVDRARDALVAALTRHATAGADTDDPRTARDHLAAAREAAEALSALRR